MALLTSIRRSLTSIAAMFVMGLLLASFALWGIPDVFVAGAKNTLVEIGKDEITAQDFLRRYDQRLKQIERQFGQPLDRTQAAALGLPGQTLQEMISERVLDHYARDLGFRASRALMIEALHQMDAFKGFDGQFDRTTYELQLRNAGFTPAQFEEELRREMARVQMLSLFVDWRPAPAVLAAPLFSYAYERRKGTVVSVPLPPEDAIEPPSDDDIAKAYEFDKEQFKTPEYRHALVAEISPDSLADPAGITEDELQAAYEERKADYQSPELRDITVVTFPKDQKDKAAEFARRLTAGEDFATLLARLTDKKPEDTALGDVTESDLVKDYNKQIAEAVFSAAKGEIVGPLASVFGWHVFRVNDITPPVARDFAQVKDELRHQLARERAEEEAYDLSTKVEDAIARGAGLQELAERFSLRLHDAWVSRDGMLREGGLAPETVRRQIQTIFSLAPGDPVEFVTEDNGGFALVEVLDVAEPEIRPLDDVKDRIRANLIAERRLAQAGEKANQLLDALKAGLAPEEAAKRVGGTVITTPAVARIEIGRGDNLAPNIARLLFDLDPDEWAEERAADGNGYVLVRLDEVRPGDPHDPQEAQAYRDLTAQLADARANDVVMMLERNLRERYGIEINTALWQELAKPQGAGDAPF